MVAPRGTYTAWHWPGAAAGAGGLAWDLTVLRDPGPTTYFWAHQWWFQGGDAAYFGLQAHDRRDDGSSGRLAVLSVWSAVGCADNPGCHGGVEGAPFWTCRLGYQWVAGRAYRLRVARTRPGWWSAWVTDQAAGERTLVGSIQVPARWGGLDLATRGSSVWTEFYGANVPGGVASCDQVPHSGVRFGVPAAEGLQRRGRWGSLGGTRWGGLGRRDRTIAGQGGQGGTVVPAARTNRLGAGDCPNSRVADAPDAEGGVLHEMGVPDWPAT